MHAEHKAVPPVSPVSDTGFSLGALSPTTEVLWLLLAHLCLPQAGFQPGVESASQQMQVSVLLGVLTSTHHLCRRSHPLISVTDRFLPLQSNRLW